MGNAHNLYRNNPRGHYAGSDNIRVVRASLRTKNDLSFIRPALRGDRPSPPLRMLLMSDKLKHHKIKTHNTTPYNFNTKKNIVLN